MSNADGPPTADLLERFLLGTLTPDEQKRVEEYVANDPTAAQTLHGLDRTADTLLNAIQASHTVPPTQPEVRDLIDTAKRLPLVNSGEKTTAMPGGLSGQSATDELTAWKGRLSPAERADELGRLGGYRLLRVLGRGGMGVVFEAEDPRLGRRVALKVVRPSIAEDQTTHDRFLREARATAAVEHENIVTIHQVGEDRGVPYLAMPLLQGESLEDRLRREGRLPVADVIRIGREIALGLAAAHEQSLIHRDIKPGNIWLDARSGRVKILDFGLARGTEQAADHITQTGAIVGTPAYMAPEQAEGLTLDSRCDLFSLGCVLYRLATGDLPFPGNSAIQILSSLASRTPPRVDTVVPNFPPALSDVIARLMAKSPTERPATADDVCKLLDRVHETPIAPPQPAPKRAVSRGGWIAIVAVLATMGGGVWWLFGGTMILIATNQGELTIQVADPNIEVTVRQNDAEVHHKSTQRRFRVRPVNGEVEFLDPETGAVALTRTFEMKRAGERAMVTITASQWVASRTNPAPAEIASVPELAKTPAPHNVPATSIPAPSTETASVGGLDFGEVGRIDTPLLLPTNTPLTVELDVTQRAVHTLETQCFLFQHPRNLDIKLIGDRAVVSSGGWPNLRANIVGAGLVQPGRRRQIVGTVSDTHTQLFVDGKLVERKLSLNPETSGVQLVKLGFPGYANNFRALDGLVHRVRISRGEHYNKNYTPETEWQPDETTLALYDFRSVPPKDTSTTAVTTSPLRTASYPTSPADLPAGFTSLFNAKDLAGWRAAAEDPKKRAEMKPDELAKAQAAADQELSSHWRVSQEVLHCDGHGKNLSTLKNYTDFELYLEWKIGAGGDSGVYLRGTPQVQIWDSATVQWGNNQGSGGLFNNKKHPNKPLVNADKPVGEWNAMFIRMVGEKVTVSLNGQLVVDNVVYENFVEPDQPIYLAGPIELQRYGTPVEFRSLWIRELASGALPVIAGMEVQDLSGKGNHGKIVSSKWVPPRGSEVSVAQPPPVVGGLDFGEIGHIDTSLQLPINTPLTVELDVTHGDVHPLENQCFLLQHSRNLDIKIMADRAAVTSGGWPNLRATIDQSDVAQPGRRRQIAVTSSDTALQLFVDGKLLERKPASSPDNSGMQQLLKLGFPGANESFRAFDGLIHRVRISRGEKYDKSYKPEPEWQPDESTLALYDFRTVDPGTEVQDLSAKKNHGKIVSSKWVKGAEPTKSAANTTAVSPRYALDFSSTDDDNPPHVLLPKILHQQQPFTAEMFVKVEKSRGLKHQMLFNLQGRPKLFVSGNDSLVWQVQHTPTSAESWSAMTKMPFGRRLHVAAVSTGSEIRLFIDGQFVDKSEMTISNYLFYAEIGGNPQNKHPSWGVLNGQIDQVRISTTARYDKDFSPPTRMAAESDTLVLYDFDEGYGDVLNDRSGHGHHGKIVGAKWVRMPVQAASENTKSAVTATNRFALQFDGDDDVKVRNVNWGRLVNYTLEAFATPERCGEAVGFIVFQKLNTTLALNRRETARNWFMGFSHSENEPPEYLYGHAPAELKKRVHLAGVVNGKQFRLYVDGKLAGTTTAKREQNGVPGDTVVFGGNYMGTIDGIRLSKSARYEAPFTPPSRMEKDDEALALYHFAEGTGEFLMDSSGNGHHGEIVGAKWVPVAAP